MLVSGQEGAVDNKTSRRYPSLRSFVVLRKESFGGFIFNPYLPPEERLDPIRYSIAAMCNGANRPEDISLALATRLAHSRDYIDQLVKNALDDFTNRFLLFWRQTPLEAPQNGHSGTETDASGANHLSAPLFVIWELTGKCNLRCRHCLADAGEPHGNELSTEEVKGLLDQMERMGVFTVDFSGGEPLVRPDIFEILDYASKKRLSIDLLSNGFSITEETAGRLRTTNIFHVQLSLDGTRRTHDEFRGIEGSFDRVLKAMDTLRKNGIAVSVSSTITKKNLGELDDIVQILMDNGIDAFKTTLFMSAGRGIAAKEELRMSPPEVKEFTIKLKQVKERVKERIRVANEDVYPWLLNPEEYSEAAKGSCDRAIGCTAGNTSIYITADGTVIPCPFLRAFPAGDTRTTSLQDIWHNAGILATLRNIKKGDLKGKCGSCEYLGNICFGGCRAAAYANSKDIFAEDPLCWKTS